MPGILSPRGAASADAYRHSIRPACPRPHTAAALSLFPSVPSPASYAQLRRPAGPAPVCSLLSPPPFRFGYSQNVSAGGAFVSVLVRAGPPDSPRAVTHLGGLPAGGYGRSYVAPAASAPDTAARDFTSSPLVAEPGLVRPSAAAGILY